jgi:hypothetical protein
MSIPKRIRCDDFDSGMIMRLDAHGCEVQSCNACINVLWLCGTNTFECSATGQTGKISYGGGFLSKCPLKKVRKISYYEEL